MPGRIAQFDQLPQRRAHGGVGGIHPTLAQGHDHPGQIARREVRHAPGQTGRMQRQPSAHPRPDADHPLPGIAKHRCARQADAVQPADGSLDLTDVSILDAQSNAYQPTTLQLIESGQRLVVQFSPGLLPDMKRYTINLADNFKGTQPPYPVVGGTRACQVRLLCGDTNNDNKVDILDLMAIKNANRDPADATNCSVDISADGEVNVIDLAITNSYYGRTVP